MMIREIPNNLPAVGSPSSGEQGFTLVELLVAVLILSVGLLSVAGLTVTVIKGDLRSKQITTSTALCQQKLEEYKIKPFSNFTTGTPTTEDFCQILDVDGSSATFSGYRRVVTIQNGPATNMRTVSVRVERKPDNARTSLVTILAK